MTQFLVEQKVDIVLGLAIRACTLIKGRVVLSETVEKLRCRENLAELYLSLAGDDAGK